MDDGSAWNAASVLIISTNFIALLMRLTAVSGGALLLSTSARGRERARQNLARGAEDVLEVGRELHQGLCHGNEHIRHSHS